MPAMNHNSNCAHRMPLRTLTRRMREAVWKPLSSFEGVEEDDGFVELLERRRQLIRDMPGEPGIWNMPPYIVDQEGRPLYSGTLLSQWLDLNVINELTRYRIWARRAINNLQRRRRMITNMLQLGFASLTRPLTQQLRLGFARTRPRPSETLPNPKRRRRN